MYLLASICIVVLGHAALATPLAPSSPLTQYFDTRIVGGSPAKPGQAPHMVGLAVGDVFKSFVCGGSIISDNHVLTAAHCITSMIQWDDTLMQSFHGIVGSNRWNEGGLIIKYKAHHIHPFYNPATIKYDGAILVVDKPLKFNDKIAPIGLDFEWVAGGVKSYVTGWGREGLWGNLPDDLLILYVDTMNTEECAWRIWELAGGWGPSVDPVSEICTFHSAGHGMCHGDSGSALVSVDSGLQLGIVAWGIPCAVGGPDVFTRVKVMESFIYSILRQEQ